MKVSLEQAAGSGNGVRGGGQMETVVVEEVEEPLPVEMADSSADKMRRAMAVLDALVDSIEVRAAACFRVEVRSAYHVEWPLRHRQTENCPGGSPT